MPKRKLSYPPKLVAELAVALRAVPGAAGINNDDPLGGTLWTLAMLIGASKEKNLVKAAERTTAAVGIPVELADGLVSVAYAFVEAMAEVRCKADAQSKADARTAAEA